MRSTWSDDQARVCFRYLLWIGMPICNHLLVGEATFWLSSRLNDQRSLTTWHNSTTCRLECDSGDIEPTTIHPQGSPLRLVAFHSNGLTPWAFMSLPVIRIYRYSIVYCNMSEVKIVFRRRPSVAGHKLVWLGMKFCNELSRGTSEMLRPSQPGFAVKL